MPEAKTEFTNLPETPELLEARRRELTVLLRALGPPGENDEEAKPLLRELVVITQQLRRRNAGPPRRKEPKAPRAKKPKTLADVLDL